MRELSCPACGGPHEVHNPGVMMFVCEFCENAVYFDQEKARAAGKQTVPPEGFSRLFRGASGAIGERRFVVLGRVRYSFGRGFWDEWYLEMEDGSIEWLTEDDHELALQQRVEGVTVSPHESYQPGSWIRIPKEHMPPGSEASMLPEIFGAFTVEEVGEALCIGVEGDLPRVIESGETYRYVDASSPAGLYTLGIEYDDEPPSVYLGRWLKAAELSLDEEGIDW